MSALLEIRNARKSFGALTVTDDVSLAVQPGEIHALIGPNGAGKSCLIGEITGELALDAGEVHFDGQRIDRLPVHRRAGAGLKRAYQVPQFFSSFSARDNVALAEIARTRTGWRLWQRAPADPELRAAASSFLQQVGLEAVAERRASTLGHGEKRQLELAMGFAAQPKLLLLDEPLAGLGPGDSERMVAMLAGLKGRYAMLLVEHDVDAVFSLADRISVLVAGRIIASGSAAEIQGNAAVRSAYLGEKA
jgi:branched-chain amino acid transport system ATP-binding protein